MAEGSAEKGGAADAATVPAVKKKRPWRAKVRREAKKAAARQQREEEERKQKRAERKKRKRAEDAEDEIVEDEPVKKKKKKVKPEVEEAEGSKDNDEEKKKKKRKKKQVSIEKKEEETTEQEKRLESGRFRFLNEQLYTMTGKDAWKLFKEDPKAFECYHQGYRAQARKWPNYPLHSICSWLGKLDPGKIVLDLGCGDAKIAESMGDRHKVLSFDLVATNERVTACDMANFPVETATADVAIFCLSLMGTNIGDYIHEAARALKKGGILKIAEVASRFDNFKSFCDGVRGIGFRLVTMKKVTDYFVTFEFVRLPKKPRKPASWLQLKPCLYKKR